MLIYSGRKLVDSDELSTYKIQPGSCLILIIKPGFERKGPKPVQRTSTVAVHDEPNHSPRLSPVEPNLPPTIETAPPTSFVQGWKYPFNSNFGNMISDVNVFESEKNEEQSYYDDSR